MLVGCFFKKGNSLYVVQPDESEALLLNAKNAFVSKKKYYWKLKEILGNEKLDKDEHFLIKDGKKIDNYCNLCTDRLVSITKGCSDCKFKQMVEFGSFEMDDLIKSLKKGGFYEVDQKIFENEIEFLKSKKSNS
jgi:hypothetical protein